MRANTLQEKQSPRASNAIRTLFVFTYSYPGLFTLRTLCQNCYELIVRETLISK